MSATVDVPLWLAVALAAASALYVAEKLLIPSVRWMIRRRVNRVITEINEHLRIELRPFQLTKRKVLIDRLVFDPLVMEAMEAYVRERGMPREVAQERIRGYAREIVPAFNAYVYYRMVYRLCRYVCRQLYRVRVGVADVREIRAIDRDATIVFVMNHRSNVDYMLLAYLASRQTTLSYAAGEWAKVFLLQSLIRAMGAYFVRRNSNNPLYRRVLERYVHMASREGVCQAVFPEGGLTRDGALASPRLGFLDYMLRGYDTERDRDIVFVPVGINYDKVLEDRIQLDAGQGRARRRSVLAWCATIVRFLVRHYTMPAATRRDRFGYASVNFGHPVSAASFARRHAINFSALDKESRFVHTAALAQLLMNGIGHVTPVLPVPLIAHVFERDPDAVRDERAVISAVHELVDELVQRGAPLGDADKPGRKTVSKSLALMAHHGMLLCGDDGHYRRADGGAELLGYYAASISHWHNALDHVDPTAFRIAPAAS